MNRRNLWMGAVCLFFLIFSVFSQETQARRKYTVKQIHELIQKAQARAIRDAQSKDKQLQKYKKQLQQRQKRGKRSLVGRPGGGGGGATAARRMRAADPKTKALQRKIKQRNKAIKRNATKNFLDRIKKIKKIAASKAKAFFAGRRKQIIKKILMLAKSKLTKAKGFMKPKLKAKLLKLLRSKKSIGQIKSLMYREKTAAQLSKGIAKAAVFAAVRIVAFTALKITYTCWRYSGEKKRKCYQKELTVGMRDALFQITAKFVAIVIDLSIIEPMSHTAATAVASSMAAATAGIGAVSYPIVYAACSVSANLSVWALFSQALRPEYNKLFRQIEPSVSRFNASLVKNIPNNLLKCWGGPKVCGPACNHGQFKDTKGYCWSCPKGYKVDKTKKGSVPVCKGLIDVKAKYHRKSRTLIHKCSPGTFFDPRGGGECWSCPRGYKRSLSPVTSPAACYLRKWTKTRATKHRKSKGLWCPKGMFFDLIDGGTCWSCPRGLNRAANHVKSWDACKGVKTFQSRAKFHRKRKLFRSACARGTFFDPRRGGECWSCPRKYGRTVYPVTGNSACRGWNWRRATKRGRAK